MRVRCDCSACLFGCASDVGAHRVKQEGARVPGRLFSRFEPRPPVAQGRSLITYPLSKAPPLLNLLWVPRCARVLCAAGGDTFSIGHGAVKLFEIFGGCVCAFAVSRIDCVASVAGYCQSATVSVPPLRRPTAASPATRRPWRRNPCPARRRAKNHRVSSRAPWMSEFPDAARQAHDAWLPAP